ncbi:MAG: tripartite tricarboxylate transporter substrate binding protein [Gammaproteobacteria bacterium]
MRHNRPNTLFHIDAGKTPVRRDTPALTRRRWLRLGAAAGLAGALPALRAQPPFPARPLQLIVPWPAGGQTDLTLRVLAEEAEPLLGQPVVVVNKPGAAGTLVAPLLKAAEPDGHTIGQVPITVYRHALMNHVAWDPLTDLAPILQVSGVSFGLLVPAGSPFKTANDLIDWAVRHPGELILGSTGIGTTAHLAMEEILLGKGVRYVHVPYKGTADQMLAIATGQIMAGVNSTGFAPWVDKGQMRLLATFNATRNPRWPDAPTLRELGHPQAVYTSPWGLAAPAGTPAAVIQTLHDAFHQAMLRPRHTELLAKYDQSIDYLGTRDYRAAVLATVEREKKLLARMNLLAKPAS